jgi:predicted transposase YbfD/YdcC
MSQAGPLALLDHFAHLSDPRDHRARRHLLSDVLVIGFCAVLAGADSWPLIAAFGRSKIDWFKRLLALPNGIPSHDTFRRVFAALDPIAFQNGFVSWINAISEPLGLKHYAIDGKALRGSNRGLGCLQTVSVWADEIGLSLAQIKVDDDSNEIPAIPKLLRLLDLAGAIVTIDAAGCQKEVAFVTREQGGDYLVAVKGNQPTLYEDVKACFARAEAVSFTGYQHASCHQEQSGHGRHEERTYTVIYDPDGLSTRDQWQDLSAIVRVKRVRVVDGKRSEETAYYVSSSRARIKRLAEGIRRHWGIENRCHWSLDVLFGEDRCRTQVGHAAENLAWVRRVALSLLRQHPDKDTLKAKQRRAGWDNAFLGELMDLLHLPPDQ